MGLVEVDSQRQGERPPALRLPVLAEPRDAGVVVHRGVGIGAFRPLLRRVVASVSVHAPKRLCLGVVGRHVGQADWPGRRNATGMLHLAEIAAAQPHQRRPIERGVAADPIVGVRAERLAGLVVPLFLGPIAVLDEHRLGAPVLRLARQLFATFQDQDRLARRGQSLRQRPAPRARPDDHHVKMRHVLPPLSRPDRSIARRRPLPRRMDERQHPDRLAIDLVDQSVTLTRDQFARPGNSSAPAPHREILKALRRIAEKPVHPHCGVRTVRHDAVPDVCAVRSRLWRPEDRHASRAALDRRAANSASTSLLDRPRPERIEDREASTLPRRKAS